MTIADIKDRDHVLLAMAEFDRVGRKQFLEKYGFKPSRSYWLVHEGRRYDSKAIVGAAHGYARPDLGPLSAADFSGGFATVQRKLENLGFNVEGPQRGADGGNAFLLTWKESGWPHSNILRMCDAFKRQGFVEEPWRIHAHRKAKVGDRVWLLKQGRGPKGIFGKGTITGLATLGDAGNGKQQMMAPVRFSAFTDPEARLLVDEARTREIISGRQMRAQASGDPLTDEQSAALEQIVPDELEPPRVIGPDQGDDAPFDPTGISDARERISRTIAQRRGQSPFRDALIAAYRARCAITGCDVLDVLEAAHVHPYLGPETNKVTNGLLLRADIHTLFDCSLIDIDPASLTVIVASSLRNSMYGPLHGQALRPPKQPSQAVSRKALESRRAMMVRMVDLPQSFAPNLCNENTQ
jgi:putative restriction endonuclease